MMESTRSLVIGTVSIILLCLVIAVAFGGDDPEATRDTLYKSGYTEVETLGYAAWGCGKGDYRNTKFRAKNVRGDTVEGVVCCGSNGCGKSCTVRF